MRRFPEGALSRVPAPRFFFSLPSVAPARRIFRAMANKDEKTNGNVPGKFYVDTQCIDCDLCRSAAPDFFGRNDDDGVSVVIKQPTTADEIAQCEEAKASCPVDAIGDDGDE